MDPLEIFYYAGYSIKKYYSLKNQKRLPRKVISIGNITAGGTGKTPAVIATAETAREHGYFPIVLTRGYRGSQKGPVFVRDDRGGLLTSDEAGDEAVMLADKLKDIPVVKAANRYEAGMFALNNKPSALSRQPVLFILDDGFQHWGLYRDIDILLIDSGNPFGNGKLLPSGRLREPLAEIKRADIIVITKTKLKQPSVSGNNEVSALIDKIRGFNMDAPIFCAGHVPRYIRTVSGEKLPLENFKGLPAVGFCGIGNPASFRNTLLGLDIELKYFIPFRDHYKYTAKDVMRINKMAEECNADWIITTEKDIMRLRGFDFASSFGSVVVEFSAEPRFYEKIFPEE